MRWDSDSLFLAPLAPQLFNTFFSPHTSNAGLAQQLPTICGEEPWEPREMLLQNLQKEKISQPTNLSFSALPSLMVCQAHYWFGAQNTNSALKLFQPIEGVQFLRRQLSSETVMDNKVWEKQNLNHWSLLPHCSSAWHTCQAGNFHHTAWPNTILEMNELRVCSLFGVNTLHNLLHCLGTKLDGWNNCLSHSQRLDPPFLVIYHRIMEWLGLEGTSNVTNIQPGTEHLQGWGIQNLWATCSSALLPSQ